MDGFLITFEGIEGTGKSTQAKALCEELSRQGLPVRLTREPGGTPIGDEIRAILANPEYSKMNQLTELLLYSASRAQHVHETFRPSLEEGYIVICDRFIDSSVAYQGFGRGIPLSFIRELNSAAAWGIVPNLTIYLDLEPQTAFKRLKLRLEETETIPDRLERESLDFFGRVRDGYLSIAKDEPVRFRTFDAYCEPEELHKKIVDVVQREIRKAGFHTGRENSWNLEHL